MSDLALTDISLKAMTGRKRSRIDAQDIKVDHSSAWQSIIRLIQERAPADEIRPLIDHVQNINEYDTVTGMTLLNHACLYGNLQTVKMLILNGCSYSIFSLLAAVQGGHLEVVRYLVDICKMHPDTCTTRTLATPMHEACKSPNTSVELVRFLLDRGANPASRDVLDRTPQDMIDLFPTTHSEEIKKVLQEHPVQKTSIKK